MKLSLLTAVAGLAGLVLSQASLPQCGINVLIAGIAQSGCAFSDANCVCKAQSFVRAASKDLTKACRKSPTDLNTFLSFINAQCNGQPGFPIVPKDASPTTSGAMPSGSANPASNSAASMRAGSWTALLVTVGVLVGL